MTLARLSHATAVLVGRIPSAIIEWLAMVPTTNLRVCVTLVCVVMTTTRYVSSTTWVPDLTWLGFLVAMSGLDSAHFLGKRMTDSEYVAAKAKPPDA